MFVIVILTLVLSSIAGFFFLDAVHSGGLNSQAQELFDIYSVLNLVLFLVTILIAIILAIGPKSKSALLYPQQNRNSFSDYILLLVFPFLATIAGYVSVLNYWAGRVRILDEGEALVIKFNEHVAVASFTIAVILFGLSVIYWIIFAAFPSNKPAVSATTEPASAEVPAVQDPQSDDIPDADPVSIQK